MNNAIWTSTKSSPMYSDIRQALIAKADPGQATLPRKEAKRVWREDILGILTDAQKKDIIKKRIDSKARATKRQTTE